MTHFRNVISLIKRIKKHILKLIYTKNMSFKLKSTKQQKSSHQNQRLSQTTSSNTNINILFRYLA